jgi:transcriptional regulator GlxA family with amidase domain
LSSTALRWPGTLPTNAGYGIAVENDLGTLRGAHTVVMPSWDPDQEPSDRLLDALRVAHARGARVLGLCLGAFPVAAAGIVDGREVATHWRAAAELERRYPAVRVRPAVLWADHGDVITSAGVAAALDCCLHVVRHDLGASAATDVARRLVLAPHRDGTQAQYIPTPVVDVRAATPISNALEWAMQRLDRQFTVNDWARAAQMSQRTFVRRFHDGTGTSPGSWLLHQRLARARLLLETGTDTVEAVATATGFATAASLRQHFARRFGTSPARHRAAFSS